MTPFSEHLQLVARRAWDAALEEASRIADSYPDGSWPPTGIPGEIAHEIRKEITDD